LIENDATSFQVMSRSFPGGLDRDLEVLRLVGPTLVGNQSSLRSIRFTWPFFI
jgi:hypothetical protein